MSRPSNRYDYRRAAAQEGFLVIFYRAENKYEIYGSPLGKISRATLAKVLVKDLQVPIEELALAHTEFKFQPQAVRAEFGIDGSFLYVA